MTNGWRVHIDKETGAADVINEAGDAVASYCTPKHASLIAAAPDLYEALLGLYVLFLKFRSPPSARAMERTPCPFEEAEAALAKARGESVG